ncbi:MAG: peptidoglycan DD-metalloendopeptidase family protein [Methylococcales bacterium]|nr:peptidoglycan DD-metalloendopeptidase family protein [Methylococcales bacterium]
MAPRPSVSLNSPSKPSKLLAVFALAVAFTLPFILVKSFPHKNKSGFGSIPQSLPVEGTHYEEIDESDEPAADTEDGADAVDAPSSPVITTEAPKAATPPTEITTKSASSAAASQPVSSPQPVKPAKASEPVAKSEWKIVKTRDRDSLANVFNRSGLSAQTLHTIMRENSRIKVLSQLKPNQELQLLINNHTLEKMLIPLTTTQYVVIYREGEHYKSKINTHKMNSHNHFLTATVNGSLYGTAKRQNIPYKLIRQMTEIFSSDIDFAREVRAGDQFTIIYKAFYIENKLVSTGDIIAVTYRNRGKVFQAVRHTNRAGRSEYYTPQGRGLKKAFIRYPIRFSHISSTFSLSRYHPILHYRRAHKGVDLAARIGTPIQATGDGRIEIIGRQNAYGNMIKINHSKTYSSIYGHMLKFQKGLSKGSYVKRGQIIGYVGQTGLASGPHCHYEFHVNNQPKNPTTIDLPRGEPITGRELARFKVNTNTLLAQLKLFEEAHLASASKKGPKHG